MSIELYIQGFSDGESAGIPESLVLKIFSVADAPDDEGLHTLDYGPGADCLMSIDLEDGVAVAVTIFRPVTAKQLWVSVFSLLGQASYIAYTSEGRAAVASANTLSELPPDMVESFDVIAEVASADELIEALFD